MPVEEMSLPCSWLPPAVFTTLEVEMSYRSLNCQPYVNTQSRTRTSGNGVGMAGTGTSNTHVCQQERGEEDGLDGREGKV